jgi:hypothetical protein
MAPGPGPVQEGLPVIHLVLQRADEALGGGVIPVNRGRSGGVGAGGQGPLIGRAIPASAGAWEETMIGRGWQP